jgi:hypothetical protein
MAFVEKKKAFTPFNFLRSLTIREIWHQEEVASFLKPYHHRLPLLPFTN